MTATQLTFINRRSRILTVRHASLWVKKFGMYMSMYVLVPCIMMYGFSTAFGLTSETMRFMLPGFMINASGIAAFAAATYGTFMRLTMEKLYDSWLAATVTVPELVAAEVMWAVARGVIIALGVTLAGCLLAGEWPLGAILLALPFVMLTSAVACLLGLMVAARARSFDDLTMFEPVTAAIFVFSGVFVATSAFPGFIQYAVMVQPIYHGIELVRPLFMGGADLGMMALHTGVLLAMVALAFWGTCVLFTKRILGQ